MKLRYLIPILFIVFGIVFIVIGAVGYYFVPKLVRGQLADALIVSSSSSQGYSAFIDSRNGEDRGGGLYVSYTIFNLTNPEDFKAGRRLPNFSPVGPFVYIKRTQKSEVTFLNGGVQVRYKGQISYTFVPEKSGVSVDTTANLLLVNPYYIAAQKKAGSELNLNITMASLQFTKLQQVLANERLSFTQSPKCISLAPGKVAANICTFYTYKDEKGLTDMFSAETGSKILASFANAKTLTSYYAAWKSNMESNTDSQLRAIFLVWETSYTLRKAQTLMSYIEYVNDNIQLTGAALVGTDLGLVFERTGARSFLFDEDQFSKIILGQPGNRIITDESEIGTSSFYTSYTGSDNNQDINGLHFSEYAGHRIIEYYPRKYIMNFRVRSIAAFQDPPSNAANIYYELVKGPIPIQKSGSATVDGLPVQVYRINTTSLFEVNLDYNNTISGFFSLESVTDGTPFLLSAPYYIGANSKYSSMVTGMQLPNNYDPISTMTIESSTGLPVNFKLNMQLNLRIDFEKMAYNNINNSLFSSVLMYPMLLMQDNLEMSKDSIALIKSINMTNSPFYILFVSFLVIGSLLLFIGIIILLCASFCCDENQKRRIVRRVKVPRNKREDLVDPGLPKKQGSMQSKDLKDTKETKDEVVSIVSKAQKTLNVRDTDIQIVMMNAGVDLHVALEALKNNEGNVIESIHNLNKNKAHHTVLMGQPGALTRKEKEELEKQNRK